LAKKPAQQSLGFWIGQGFNSELDTRNNRDFGGAMIRFVVDGA